MSGQPLVLIESQWLAARNMTTKDDEAKLMDDVFSLDTQVIYTLVVIAPRSYAAAQETWCLIRDGYQKDLAAKQFADMNSVAIDSFETDGEDRARANYVFPMTLAQWTEGHNRADDVNDFLATTRGNHIAIALCFLTGTHGDAEYMLTNLLLQEFQDAVYDESIKEFFRRLVHRDRTKGAQEALRATDSSESHSFEKLSRCIDRLAGALRGNTNWETKLGEIARLCFTVLWVLFIMAQHAHPTFPVMADWAILARLKQPMLIQKCIYENTSRKRNEPLWHASCFANGQLVFGSGSDSETLYINLTDQPSWTRLNLKPSSAFAELLRTKFNTETRETESSIAVDSGIWQHADLIKYATVAGKTPRRSRRRRQRRQSPVREASPTGELFTPIEGSSDTRSEWSAGGADTLRSPVVESTEVPLTPPVLELDSGSDAGSQSQ